MAAPCTQQALWTMARGGLNVTTVVFANRDYAVLKREFSYLGVGSPGTRAADMFEIGRPDLDWTLLAKGMGVLGTRVNSLDAFGKALRAGLAICRSSSLDQFQRRNVDAIGTLDGTRCLIEWKTTSSRYPEEPDGLLSARSSTCLLFLDHGWQVALE